VATLDLDSLTVLKEVMEEEFVPLIELYLRDSEARLVAMDAAMSQADAESLRHTIHSFKGASSNVCATALVALAQVAEDHAREGNLTTMQDQLTELNAEYQRVKVALTSFL